MNMLAVYTQTRCKYTQPKKVFGLLHTINSTATANMSNV